MLDKMTNLAYSYCEETSFFDPCSFETNFNTLDHVVLPYDLYDLDDNAFDSHLLDCDTPEGKEAYPSGLDDIFGLEDMMGENMLLSPLPPSPANLKMMRNMMFKETSSNNTTHAAAAALPNGNFQNQSSSGRPLDSTYFYDHPLDLKNILSPSACLPDIKMGGQQQQTFDLSQLIMHFEQHLDSEKDDFRRTEDILNFQRDLDSYLTSPRPLLKPSCPAAATSHEPKDNTGIKNRSHFAVEAIDSSPHCCSSGSLSSSPLDCPSQLMAMVSSPSLCTLSDSATVFDFSDLLLGDAYQDLPLQNALLHQSTTKTAASANGIKKEKNKTLAKSQLSNANNNSTTTLTNNTQSTSPQTPPISHHMDDHDYCRYYPAHPLSDALGEANINGKKILPTILPKRGVSGNQSLSHNKQSLLPQTLPKGFQASCMERDSASPITLSIPQKSSANTGGQRPVRLVSLLGTAPSTTSATALPVPPKDSQSRRRKRQISLNNGVNPSQRAASQHQPQQQQSRQHQLGLAKKCKPTIVTATNERGEVRILAQSNMPPNPPLNLTLPLTQVISAGIAPSAPTPALHSSVKQEFDPEAFAPTPSTTTLRQHQEASPISSLLPKQLRDVDNFIEVAGQELDNDFLAFLLTKEEGEDLVVAEPNQKHPSTIDSPAIGNPTNVVSPKTTTSHHRPLDKSGSPSRPNPPSRFKGCNNTITTSTTITTTPVPSTNTKKAKTALRDFTTSEVKKEPPPSCSSPPLFSSWNDMTTLVDLDLKRVERDNSPVTSSAQQAPLPPLANKNGHKATPFHGTTVRTHSASSIKNSTNHRHHISRLSPEKAASTLVNNENDGSSQDDQECGFVKVNGISDTLGLGDVKSLFKKFGPIKNVVINACTTNRYAIVTYHNKRDAQTAVRRGNHIAGNNKFEVSIHTPRDHQSNRQLLPPITTSGELKNVVLNQQIGKSDAIPITSKPSRLTPPHPSRTLRSCRNESSPSSALLLCS